jgi:hypothetical protein
MDLLIVMNSNVCGKSSHILVWGVISNLGGETEENYEKAVRIVKVPA